MREVVSNECEGQSIVRKAKNRQSMSKSRANESEQDSVVRKSVDRQCKARARLDQSRKGLVHTACACV